MVENHSVHSIMEKYFSVTNEVRHLLRKWFEADERIDEFFFYFDLGTGDDDGPRGVSI
jgi:hypothetical protein